MDMIKFADLESRLIRYKNEYVLVDSDVAQLYGVKTREINQAVSNNLDKFPDGYIIQLTKEDKSELIKNFDRFDKLKHSTVSSMARSSKQQPNLSLILDLPKSAEV